MRSTAKEIKISMRTGNLLMSAVHFLFAMAVLCASIFSLLLAYNPILRASFLSSLEREVFFFILGLSGLILSLVLLVGFYFLYRRSYYRVKMGEHVLEMEPALINQYVTSFWKEHLPDYQITSEVLVHSHHKIEIMASLESPSELLMVLEEIEEPLKRVLFKNIGYRDELVLTVLDR